MALRGSRRSTVDPVLTYRDRPLGTRTRAVYEREALAWKRWCVENGERIFPPAATAVARYLTQLFAQGYAMNTLETKRAAISVFHDTEAADIQRAGGEPPHNAVYDLTVTATLAKLASEAEHSEVKAKPLRYPELVRICEAQPPTAVGYRNRAMAAVAWWGLMRGSEVTRLRRDDLSFEERGVNVRIREAKTDRRRVNQYIALTDRTDLIINPVFELRRWLDIAPGDRTSPVFRRIFKTKNPDAPRFGDSALSYDAWDDIFAKMVLAANLEEPELYSTHSFRSGGGTELATEGGSLVQLQRAGRWATAAQAAEYVRMAPLADNPMNLIRATGERSQKGSL